MSSIRSFSRCLSYQVLDLVPDIQGATWSTQMCLSSLSPDKRPSSCSTHECPCSSPLLLSLPRSSVPRHLWCPVSVHCSLFDPASSCAEGSSYWTCILGSPQIKLWGAFQILGPRGEEMSPVCAWRSREAGLHFWKISFFHVSGIWKYSTVKKM